MYSKLFRIHLALVPLSIYWMSTISMEVYENQKKFKVGRAFFFLIIFSSSEHLLERSCLPLGNPRGEGKSCLLSWQRLLLLPPLFFFLFRRIKGTLRLSCVLKQCSKSVAEDCPRKVIQKPVPYVLLLTCSVPSSFDWNYADTGFN